jgi:hypothetical protein
LHARWAHPGWIRALPVALVAVMAATAITHVQAGESHEIEQDEFWLVWERTEAPVANRDTQRSWLWGPEPRTRSMSERYLDSPGEERTVQYFDKGRMEVNDPQADPSDPWFVTSGLLTRELISGEIQIGDDAFLDTDQGASIQVAGDHLNPFPQYRHLDDVVDHGNPDRTGERADKVLTPDGLDPGITPPDDPRAEFVEHFTYLGPDGHDVGYNIAEAFWSYLNAPGTVYDSNGNPTMANPLFSWIYVMGFPISDPLWAEVPVGGNIQWVLIQPFERRVLTYTPGNNPEWQVEMGNIGQHYRDWRSQYFPEAVTGGDPDFFGLRSQAFWRYGNVAGIDEVWEAAGTTESFVPGSTLYARNETGPNGSRTTYWSPGHDGLYLHGFDERDGNGDLVDMVVYSPALRVMDSSWLSQELTSHSTALSLSGTPESTRLVFEMHSRPIVVTPAGEFQTWRIDTTDFANASVSHGLGTRYWFEPGLGIVQWLVGEEYSAWLVESSELDN